MDRPTSRQRTRYIAYGALSLCLAMGVAAGMVLRGTGTFESTDDVFVEVPAAAGLVNGGAPVRYHGVEVGRIASVEAGSTESQVRLAIDSAAAKLVPSAVLARVVPRTFFGDIYVELVDPEGDTTITAGSTLGEVDTIAVDSGPEAVAMYDVFTKMAGVLDDMRPDQLSVALSALSSALDGHGQTIGRTIDRFAAVSDTMAPAAADFLDATPQFVEVMRSLSVATPDIVGMVASAAEVSGAIVESRDRLADTFDAATLLAASVDGFTGERRDSMITVTNSVGAILATTAANPSGLYSTLESAESFGNAGARVFSTGRFNITAVPSFADPLPYTSADCPSYGSMTGRECNSPGNGTYSAPTRIVGGRDEAEPLQLLQDTLSVPGVALPDSLDEVAEALNPATSFILGPFVRGNEVQIP
ncbi:MCE family protein [Rhodococcus sp. HNM0563]|uniref:MCE family protein n=1 Tax=Rhodococcus sp. HNM0563 TaxID=2716339 RepID=UPI00146D8F77|nr:MCE family protein [Rhodococcus sp. HNM0563]NLU62084.1 MCE family protein [Rhodococcus sp. HNM0563]